MAASVRGRIAMTEAEVALFLGQQRNATLGTVGPGGFPHLVGMWYAIVDGQIWIETKAKSQKAANLRRDDRVSFLVQDGLTYDCLRGVSVEGHAVISTGPDDLWRVGVSLFERYIGPYSDDQAHLVTGLIHNRIGVRLSVTRMRSWDHRKLGMPDVALGGSTARFLSR
jgi:PPOX class probable F420-dependent enzyme